MRWFTTKTKNLWRELGDRWTEHIATRHVRDGHEPMPAYVVVRRRGIAEPFDPKHNKMHERFDREAKGDPALPKKRAALAAKKEELTHETSPFILLVGILALLIVEYFGALQLLTLVGLENPTRAISAVALTTGLFALTDHATKKHAAKKSFYLTVTVYAAVVMGIAIVNLGNAQADDDAALTYEIGASIVMLITTAGPALVGKLWITSYHKVRPIHRQARELQKAISTMEHTQREASDEIDRIVRFNHYYEQERERITAIYMLAYKTATPGNPYARRQ